MTAEYKKIVQGLQQRQYATVYLADGEEPYYLDLQATLFEDQILAPSERDFNLSVLYGKDVTWADVVNACRRFPMFAERQVVVVKDAAAMSGFNEMAGYVEHPSPTTVLLLEYRGKKADARSRIVKLVKEKGIYYTSEKIREEQVPQWIRSFGEQQGFRIGDREAELLTSYLGNDLQKIANEIGKIRINVPEEKELNAALIQKYIGISRDYNVFDFPEAFSSGNKDKLYRMLAYFTANPKAAPMVLIAASFYTHFNAMYRAHFAAGRPEKEWAEAMGVSPYRAKSIMSQARKWPLAKIEQCLLLLGKYNAYTVGIDHNSSDTALLKEMIGRMELVAAS
jgi:DNA polymerase III subunit delta